MSAPGFRLAPVGFALVVLAITLPAYGLPNGFGAELRSAPAPGSGLGAASPSSPVPMAPHPSITCPITTPPTPAYTTVNNFAPPSPRLSNQYPCNYVDWDEIHATYSSSGAHSGSRWTLPVELPADTATTAMSHDYYQVAVGEVVAGDIASAWRQSYAQVIFQPAGTTWSAAVAIWSLQNDTLYGGTNTESSAVCNGTFQVNYQWLSWNSSFFCEQLVGTTTLSSITSGSFLNVTWVGTKGGSTGLTVYVNDSTFPSEDSSWTLSAANTGSDTFTPYYDAACLDSCGLIWGFPYGQGVMILPINYSESSIRGVNPIEFGIPHYWVSSTSSYSGEFEWFSPESTSGVCNAIAPLGTVAPCIAFNVLGNTGFYPYFTMNGSVIDFGANYSWTINDWGGFNSEFYTNGNQHDLLPFLFYKNHNSSRAGFSAPATQINISAVVADLGTVTSVSLSYDLDNGAFTTVPLTLSTGTTTNGTWIGSIPSSLGNGEVNYSLSAANFAGASIRVPFAGYYHIARGPLPTFHVLGTTNLLSCGKVELDNNSYVNGTSISTLPGTYEFGAIGCYPWVFTQWSVYGGVAVLPNLQARNGLITVSANATVLASWMYVRPNDTVTIATTPSTCGSVTLGASTIGNGGSVQLPDGLNASLGESGCAGKLFSGWTFSGNFTILGTVFIPNGNGTLTANFVDSGSAVALAFVTEPGSCGGVLFRGAGYTNGESLSVLPGTYPIAPDPCYHWGWLQWNLNPSSALTVSGGNLTVSGSGTITEVNYVLTVVTFVVQPNYCGYVTFDGVVYHNGGSVVVANNSTHLVYATNITGCYLIALTGDHGITVNGNVAVVNGSGDAIASFGVGTPTDTIAFLTDPATCGTILFGNVAYQNSNFTHIAGGLTVSVATVACAGYGFVSWLTYGPVTIAGSTAYVNGSGAIEAVFKPLVNLYLLTSPFGCGTISVAGIAYPTNTTLSLPESNTYALAATPCADYAFSLWQNTSAISIGAGGFYLSGSGFLTAVFVPIVYTVGVKITPASCGSIRINGVTLTNGTSITLAAGLYPLAVAPCFGDHLDHWNVTGNLTPSNTTLDIAGGGTLWAAYAPVPPSVTLSLPTSTLAGDAVQIYAIVPVLVYPFNYTYTWTFGDGTSLVTPVNFTTHAFSGLGAHTVSVTVRDPLGRTANASAAITVLAAGATSPITLSAFEITALAIAGLAVLVIAVAAVLQRRRADRPPPPKSSSRPPARPARPPADSSPPKP